MHIYLAICVSKILKNFPYILMLVRCKILWLDMQQKYFSNIFTLYYKNDKFGVIFDRKKIYLGPLKIHRNIIQMDERDDYKKIHQKSNPSHE